MTRIMIADDHTMFREGLRRLLEFDPSFVIVGEARDGVEVVQLAPQLKPDILLLDLLMPRQSGMESLPELLQKAPRARIIFLTAHIDTHETVEALRIGARGIVLKRRVPQFAAPPPGQPANHCSTRRRKSSLDTPARDSSMARRSGSTHSRLAISDITPSRV